MTDSDTSANPDREPRAADDPLSRPASAMMRGPSVWTRLKTLFAWRTASLRDDLEVALEAEAAGQSADFSASERLILQNVLQLSERRVEDVLVPRADIEAIDGEATLGDLVKRFREVGHSRIPVYAENIDNITGFVHVKDVLRRLTELATDPAKDMPVRLTSPPLRQKLQRLGIARTVLFVPPRMPVGDLLQQMQQSRVHMAIVIDEYGGTDGLVTIEDLLEAVVGDIADEHEAADAPAIRKINSNIFVASARAELHEVKRVVGPEFDAGENGADVDTLGGLVFALAGRVPAKGEVIGGGAHFEFEVMQADTRQLRRIKIKRVKQRKPPEAINSPLK